MLRKRNLAAVGVLASVLIAISAGPALADGGAAVVGAQAFWVSSSKTLSATDTQNDGKSAIAQLRVGTKGSVSEVVESGGNGTTKSILVSVNSGTSIYLRACTQDLSAGGTRSCGSWVQRTA
jgi:hypothetical protein